MKKYLFLASVAALSFTACTNETEEFVGTGSADQQKEIAFFPLNQVATRAAGAAEYNAVEGVAYPQNYDMKVAAYVVPETGDAGNYFGTSAENGGILFKYNYKGGAAVGTNGYWGGNPAQYWPLSPATLNFLAVTKGGSPTADMVTETFNSNVASGVTVALGDNKPQAATTGTGQHDLMYAFGRAQVTQAVNVLTIPDKVDMTYNHALAWVYFRVKGASATETTGAGAITIKSITLNGAKYSGTFTAAVTNYDKAAGSGDLAWGTRQWSSADHQGNYASPNYTPATLTTSFVNVGDGLLIIPQGSMATPADAFSDFSIVYTLGGVDYTYTYQPADRQLVMGKKYIYDITFRLSEIFIEPTVVDWDAHDAGNQGQFVDIPAYNIGTNWNYGIISKAKATYKFAITGYTGNLTVATTGTETAFAEAPTVSDGVVTFKVNANTSAARNYTLVVTDESTPTPKSSTITFSQASGL